MSKKRLKTGAWLFHYLRNRLGFAAKNNVSPYELACLALAKDGRVCPEGVTSKQWATQNTQYISEESQKIKRSITITKRSIPVYATKTNGQIAKELSAAKGKQRVPKNVASDAFLQSYEWRKLRMEALKKHGARCQCCGATPATGAIMNVDHIKPRKLFPALALDLSNLQVLCHECNHGKGNWDHTDWRTPT